MAHAVASTVNAADEIGFCVFILLYTPCLATIATIKAVSKSWPYTISTLVFSLLNAWCMAFMSCQIAMLF